ncbi:MAG: tRNA (adenosine(37)-N6)-threonylcarbamoyltransferase complex transferase subunit TsaD [Candidatus Lightella neohaematopini]|nr:tRNA (adenosine(37)-N6)-threonylcarbamoyltransferase complex transferase subunit TsaD [Candidatus Lightella neohaematopini]
MRVLGIETSCDETGVAIYDSKLGILINNIYSQISTHSKYGGVVPELAARSHNENIIYLIKDALLKTHSSKNNINGIAYTAGPGLVGSLLVGASIAKSLAYAWNIPIITINHMEGHLLSPMLNNNNLSFPFLALLISGKHTQLIRANNIGNYNLLGESLDDAVGEVFDKIAVALGLKYPGGLSLSMLANYGFSNKYIFPKPLINKPNLMFSFSGLKTSVINTIFSLSNMDYQDKANIARSFEDTIIEILVHKCAKAIHISKLRKLVIAGGVSANNKLRSHLHNMINKKQGVLFYPNKELCTDNGVMIAYAGLLHLKNGKYNNLKTSIKPDWKIYSINNYN